MNDSQPTQTVGSHTVSRAAVIFAVVLDFILVCIFAVSGRMSHSLGLTFTGVLETAWPYLVGLSIGWLVFRVHRKPMALRSGVWVWIMAFALGTILRLVTGAGVALPFLIVSFLVLAVFLTGWRLIAQAFKMLSREPRSS